MQSSHEVTGTGGKRSDHARALDTLTPPTACFAKQADRGMQSHDRTDRSIVIPYFQGQRGNPILFASSYVHEVAIGERHIGCKKLANEYPDDVYRYEVTHDRFTTDLDTQEDYTRLLERFRASEASAGRTDSQSRRLITVS